MIRGGNEVVLALRGITVDMARFEPSTKSISRFAEVRLWES